MKRTLLSWLFGGAAAASFVAITQLLTKSKLSSEEHLAADYFALVLPLLVAAAIAARNWYNLAGRWRSFFGTIGFFAGGLFVADVFLLLVTFSPRIAVTFSLLTVILGLLLGNFRRGCKRTKKADDILAPRNEMVWKPFEINATATE